MRGLGCCPQNGGSLDRNRTDATADWPSGPGFAPRSEKPRVPGQVRVQRGVEFGRRTVGTEDLCADQFDLAKGETAAAAVALFHQLGPRPAAHEVGQGGTNRGLAALGTHALWHG
ncbi:MAG: hypothetical protein EB141_01300 [Verrucomicrobia bacterium]|nr:hypothetical protein [Verrucomicrobiota bacterium]NBU10449.1 hypothetical protein [Pseudomonadota bacterium]NDA66782.1 hypothetical protein [Verrucomicrobiota bacterium]NDB74280.1 hypothetical protein [Verrucomicrobiota bacterium]NDD38678.1 hypothetical protein [Verrucomicrobiota bacterium]